MKIQRPVRRTARGSRPAPIVAALLALASAGCWGPAAVDEPGKMTIGLHSRAFSEGGTIPREYTCDGAGGSPPLEWSGVPQNARELALVVEDPDAPMGTFSRWIVVGLPPGSMGLKENVPAEGVLPQASILTGAEERIESAGRQGKNDFGKMGYGGPCPPSGSHHYVFRLYALDAPLGLVSDTLTRSEVLGAIKGHILAEGRLTGLYARSK